MKANITTILGVLVTLSTLAMVFLDMYFSNNPEYTFKLEGWHVIAGLLIGVSLIVIPEEKIASLLTKYINKKIGK